MYIPHIKPRMTLKDERIYIEFSLSQQHKLKRFHRQIENYTNKIKKNISDLNWVLSNSKYGSHQYKIALTNFYNRHARLSKRLGKLIPPTDDPYGWVSAIREQKGLLPGD